MNSFTNLYSRFHPAVLVRHRHLREAYKSWHKSVILLREWPAESVLATRWVQRANIQDIAQRCAANTAPSKLVTRSVMAAHTESAHSDIWAKWMLNMNENEMHLISKLHNWGIQCVYLKVCSRNHLWMSKLGQSKWVILSAGNLHFKLDFCHHLATVLSLQTQRTLFFCETRVKLSQVLCSVQLKKVMSNICVQFYILHNMYNIYLQHTKAACIWLLIK